MPAVRGRKFKLTLPPLGILLLPSNLVWGGGGKYLIWPSNYMCNLMQSNFTYSYVWVGKGSTAVSNFSIFGWPICYRYRYLLLREQGVKGTVSRDLYVGSPSRWLAPRLAYPLSIGHYPYYCSHFLSTGRWKFFCFFSLQHSFWLRINYTQLMADHWSTPVAWPLQHSYWLNTAALQCISPIGGPDLLRINWC